MPHSTRFLLAATLSALALPSAASAAPFTVTADSAALGRCHEHLASGPSVVRRTVTQPRTGLARATLRAAGGDWDLAIFDAQTGRRVAGSTHFGATELAEGVAAEGQRLVVQ